MVRVGGSIMIDNEDKVISLVMVMLGFILWVGGAYTASAIMIVTGLSIPLVCVMTYTLFSWWHRR